MVGNGERVDVIVLASGPHAVDALGLASSVRGESAGGVPANVRHTLVRVIETLQAASYHSKTRYIRVFCRALEECLDADANAHERLARRNVFLHRLDVARIGELCKAVAKVTNTRQDEFLY